MMSILELFCSVDDFWQQFAPTWHHSLLAAGQRKRLRATQMHPSEMMTIMILFHQSHYRTFKAYYREYVQRHLRAEFPIQLSYQRFVELMPTLLVPLVAYLHTQLGRCTGISFIDSTSLAVCHNARIHQHRVFAGRAARGKTSLGWFYGFTLHLVVNDQGELLAFCLTPGTVDDRRPVASCWSSGSWANSLAIRAICLSPCWSSCWSAKDFTSSPNCGSGCAIACLSCRTNSSCASERLLRPSMINSKTSARSSIRAIAAPLTSWSTWSLG